MISSTTFISSSSTRQYSKSSFRAMSCWRKVGGGEQNITHYSSIPCAPSGSGTVSCCDTGDTCLSSGICKYTHAPSGPDQSGYYVGGCTDHSLQSPVCNNACSKFRGLCIKIRNLALLSCYLRRSSLPRCYIRRYD